jgi:uncharacterized membrane protein YbhN (UPF0104 family)
VSTTSVERPQRSRLRLAISLCVVAALVAGFVWALPGLHLAEVATQLRGAQPWPLVVAAVAAIGMHGCRAAFWRLALRVPRPIPFLRLWRYTIVGAASSTLLPARAGEAVRVWLLAELEGVPAVEGISAALAERALDGASMVIVLLPLPLLLPDAPRWVERTLALLCLAGAAVLVGITVLARRGARMDRAGEGLLSRMARALSPLSSPTRMGAGLGVLIVAWLCDLVALRLTAGALGLALPPAALLLVLFSVNLAIAVPAAPAQIGSHEAGTVVALSLLGVPRPDALAFALLYHAVHVLPLLVAAALDAPLLVRAIRGRA